MKPRQSLLGNHGYAYGRLAADEQEAYKKIYEAIKRCERISLELSPKTSGLELAQLLAYVDMDHPELFWMDGYQSRVAISENTIGLMQDEDVFEDAVNALKTGADYDGDGRISFFERQLAAGRAALDANPLLPWSTKEALSLSPVWNQWRIKHVQKRFKDYVDGCETLIEVEADDYQIFRRVFEYVASHTSYSLRKVKRAQDVRSVFIERESVCKGYAEALQYLLLQFGIPCFTAQGVVVSGSGIKGAHAWNYVKIDGVWNIVDITAGDWDLDHRPERLPRIPERIRASVVDYRCMSLDGDGYVPADFIEYPPTGTTGDYFEREGHILQPGAWGAFVKICIKLHRKTEGYVQVRNRGDFDELEKWMRSAFTLIVRLCVVVEGRAKEIRQIDSTIIEKAKALSPDDVNQAGWGDFKLQIHHISASKDTFLLTATA